MVSRFAGGRSPILASPFDEVIWMAGRLGELLVRENLISLQQLQKAQEEQKKAGGRIGYHLTKLGFIEESELTSFLSKQYGVPSINLKIGRASCRERV